MLDQLVVPMKTVIEGKFQKISKNVNAISDEEKTGWIQNLPKVGESFIFFYRGMRVITTSTVTDVQLVDKVYTITTLNSTYQFTIN